MREDEIEALRRAHARAANRRADAVTSMSEAIVRARMGESRAEVDVEVTRAEASAIARRAKAIAATEGRLVCETWATRDVSFHQVCEHRWETISETWDQCRVCKWCRSRVTLEELPDVMARRLVPPFDEIDLRKMYAFAGFVVSKMVRVRVSQHAWKTEFGDRRCGAEVRFKDYGWKEAAVFNESDLPSLFDIIKLAEKGKPRALWLSIQRLFRLSWTRPWKETR